jgi:hypothetical protein
LDALKEELGNTQKAIKREELSSAPRSANCLKDFDCFPPDANSQTEDNTYHDELKAFQI